MRRAVGLVAFALLAGAAPAYAGPPSVTISASPTADSAPLTVTFEAHRRRGLVPLELGTGATADGPSATAGSAAPTQRAATSAPRIDRFLRDRRRATAPGARVDRLQRTYDHASGPHGSHPALALSGGVDSRAQEKITAIGEREGTTIKVSPLMEARLSGLHFTIEANTPERQPVSNVAPTEWSWDVGPTETGNQELHLTLTAILSVGGHNQPRTIRTFDKVLKVHVTWYDRISGFVSDNWKWLWTAIFVPLGVWAARRYQSRRGPA